MSKSNGKSKDTLDQVLAEFELLPESQIQELISQYKKEGDEEVFRRIFNSYSRLILANAKHFAGTAQTLGKEDYMNLGVEALKRAIKTFDPSRGVKFVTYLTNGIKKSMIKYAVASDSMIRRPGHIVTTGNKAEKYKQQFQQEFGREPTIGEISEGIGVRESYIANSSKPLLLSLDAPIGQSDDSLSRSDLIGDSQNPVEDSALKEVLRQEVIEAFGALSDRERLVVELYYGLTDDGRPYNLLEISKIIGYSRQRVQQIHKEVLNKLKRDPKLKTYQ